MRERRITIWHGEHKTVYYVLTVNPANDEEWEVEASFITPGAAKAYVESMGDELL